MFNIKSEKELNKFLRILSEEAVKESKKSLKENIDPYYSRFERSIKNDGLLEQESEEAEVEEEPAEEEKEKPKKPEKQAQPEEGDSNPAREKAMSLGGYDKEVGASFDSVVTAINTMRAGRSTKDKEIQTELNDYYDRLDENERQVLLLFLKELSKILTGALDGDEAQDPSDPKTYFDITKREKTEETPPEQSDVNKGGEGEEKPKVQKPVDDQSGGEEDTSPPIKVNESQDVRYIREKVRKLMRS